MAGDSVFLRITHEDEFSFFDNGDFAGLYLGAELCPRRLAPVEKVLEIKQLCKAKNLKFVLVTPVLRQGLFDQALEWFHKVYTPGDEWVANDWGFIMAVKKSLGETKPIAGRMLGRQRRDPRIAGMIESTNANSKISLISSIWNDAACVSLVEEFGFSGIELDALDWGVITSNLPDVALSLCAAYAPVTFTPSCPISTDPLNCPRICQKLEVAVLQNEEEPSPLYSRGNALWLKGDESKARAEAKRLGARLVWSAGVPG